MTVTVADAATRPGEPFGGGMPAAELFAIVAGSPAPPANWTDWHGSRQHQGTAKLLSGRSFRRRTWPTVSYHQQGDRAQTERITERHPLAIGGDGNRIAVTDTDPAVTETFGLPRCRCDQERPEVLRDDGHGTNAAGIEAVTA